MPINIAASGYGWLAAEKPSGISVHNDPGSDLCALAASYLKTRSHLADQVGFNPADSVKPVHRLDRNTSGLVLLACIPGILARLNAQMARRDITKRYWAIVHGPVDRLDAERRWHTWRWSLSAAAAGRAHLQGRGRRQASCTRYRCIGQSRHYSLIECIAETGRTHQIRRHAALAGHPIIGDRRYGPKRAWQFLARQYQLDRIGLHAHRLEFLDPQDNRKRKVTSSGLPEELKRILGGDQFLRADQAKE